MESPILPEQDEIATRYSSTAGVEQPMLSSEYGGHDSCPLQAKSSIFAGSWSPISGHAAAANAAAPTYIHHPYAGGDSDGMFTRSWPLDPVSASLCLTGLPSTAMHYEIKPEPLIGSGECTTLETHTPLLSDNGSSTSLVEMPCESATKAAKERGAEEDIKEVDASKLRRHFLIGTNLVDGVVGKDGENGLTLWRRPVDKKNIDGIHKYNIEFTLHLQSTKSSKIYIFAVNVKFYLQQAKAFPFKLFINGHHYYSF